jgi:Flp pilus assembly protein TadG
MTSTSRGRNHRAWSHHPHPTDSTAADSDRTIARRRRRGRRGSVLVEAAFVMPILMLITFGIIEFGMAYGNAATVADASRAGARLASTGYAASATQTTYAATVGASVQHELLALNNGVPMEMWMYKANSGLPTTCAASTNCFDLLWNTSTKAWATPTGGWASPDACATTSSPNLDTVGVWVKVKSNFVTGFFGSNKIITYHTVVRLEPLPSDQCT